MKQSVLLTAIVAVACIGLGQSAHAATYSRSSQLVLPAADVKVSLFDGQFKGGASVATADTDGDGIDEIIVGAGIGGGPQVQVLSQDGDVLVSWFAYDKNMNGGVNVAAGDLDGDGRAEIVTAPMGDKEPLVKIFRADGRGIKAFMGFPSSYHEGVNVAIMPKTLTDDAYIILGTRGLRANEVRLFTPSGKLFRSIITNVARGKDTGVTVAAGWSDAWGEPVVIFGAGRESAPRIGVYSIRANVWRQTWMSFESDMKNGVNVGYKDGQIVVGPQGFETPRVRQYTDTGKFISETRVFESNFRGGVNVALADDGTTLQLAAVPVRVNKNTTAIGTKKIVVDLSDQTMTLYQGRTAISVRRISSGKWSTPTPIGTFKTRNKITVAYSRPYSLYMEYWMAITPDGKYGVHSLPYWKMRDGSRRYEGADHIGTPVSHGCIRQTVADAKSLFEWAPVGTPVIIKQ